MIVTPLVRDDGNCRWINACAYTCQHMSTCAHTQVRLEAGNCYMVDTVGVPSDVRLVENSEDVLLQLGQPDRYLP